MAGTAAVGALAACGSDPGSSSDEPAVTNASSDAAANDDERLAATTDVFAEFDNNGPGCAVAIRHPDGITDWQVGLADIERGAPIDADTVFDIGSVSKQITGGVIAALVLDDALGLDDVVGDYVEGLSVDIGATTIADLVHHTSGLPDYIELLDAELDEVTDADDALDAISASVATFEPGAEFEYSNTNYLLLAEAAATAGGDTFPALNDSLIFSRLGMDRSVVRDDQGTLLDAQATGYEEAGADWQPVSSSWRQTGDGAVHSTPRDLLAWSELFITGSADGEGVGSDEWVELMLSAGDVADEDGTSYGFGISVGNGIVSHAGSWIGYSSYLGIRPADEVAVAISCNIDELDAEGLGIAVLDIWT
jgi:CubicO group peptidase (beta-lactamase class C family)